MSSLNDCCEDGYVSASRMDRVAEGVDGAAAGEGYLFPEAAFSLHLRSLISAGMPVKMTCTISSCLFVSCQNLYR